MCVAVSWRVLQQWHGMSGGHSWVTHIMMCCLYSNVWCCKLQDARWHLYCVLQCVAVCCSVFRNDKGCLEDTNVAYYTSRCAVTPLLCAAARRSVLRQWHRVSGGQSCVSHIKMRCDTTVVCCSALQCCTVCCSSDMGMSGNLSCVMHIIMRCLCSNACCSALQCVAVWCGSDMTCLEDICVAHIMVRCLCSNVCCSTLQCAVVCCSVLQCVAAVTRYVWRIVMRHTHHDGQSPRIQTYIIHLNLMVCNNNSVYRSPNTDSTRKDMQCKRPLTHVHTHKYVCIHIWMYSYTYIRIHTHIYVFMYVCMHVCISESMYV